MKKFCLRYGLPLLFVAGIVLLDQWTKYLTVTEIGENGQIILWENVFELVYVKNNGMAWGALQNCQWLFILMTPVILFFMGWIYVRMPFEKKFLPMRILEVMLAGGAIGNLLDRMFRGEFCKGHVVDMFYVRAIHFPVFNVADSFISISFVLLIILVLFFYSEADFDQIFRLKKNDLEEKAKVASEETAEINAETDTEHHSETSTEERKESTEVIKEQSTEADTEENEMPC